MCLLTANNWLLLNSLHWLLLTTDLVLSVSDTNWSNMSWNMRWTEVIFLSVESRDGVEIWELMGNILKLNKSVSEAESGDETCLVIIVTFWPPVNPVSCQTQDTVNIRYHTKCPQTTCQGRAMLPCWTPWETTLRLDQRQTHKITTRSMLTVVNWVRSVDLISRLSIQPAR